MAHVARQLRAAEDALPDLSVGDEQAEPFVGGPLFSDKELSVWEEGEEEMFVGPVRIRGARPQPGTQ